ncbi:MAG: phosphotransferase [Myxococcota bacterium]
MKWAPRVEAHLAATIARFEPVQALWSGYGELARVHLSHGGSAIVKWVCPPEDIVHPRGFATDSSHRRKLRSYDIELAFYRRWPDGGVAGARWARLLAAERDEAEWLMVLEDLDAAGYARRQKNPPVPASDLRSGLNWLAAFHAGSMGAVPGRLWRRGTYWHLDTRPDELARMTDLRLRAAAASIDARLEGARNTCLVHGDAKAANFCFGPKEATAVDFQYVGGGVGIQDVAYFLSSTLSDDALVREADRWCDVYFEALVTALALRDHRSAVAVEEEWRALYPYAWADYVRFLDGWAPGHWRRGRYAQRQVELALADG